MKRRALALGTIVGLILALVPPAAAYVRPGDTERISVATGGAQADDASYKPSMSPDARFIAFESLASNLVPEDSNGVRDVFVHDRQTATTQRVSVASDGTQGDEESRFPSLSPDGRYIAFQSDATNLVPTDANGSDDVFLHDRQTGTTERVSVAPDGTEGNDDSRVPSIAADGRTVAFWSAASNLVPGDTAIGADVFVRDGQTGLIERVSVGPAGVEGNDWSYGAVITPDGRRIAFESAASNLALGDLNETRDVFVHDRDTGITELVSVPSDGAVREEYSRHLGGPFSADPTISADGRYVAFDSQSTRLVPGDANGGYDVFVRDRQTRTTERISVASNGAEGDGAGYEPFISADGRYVAFTSTAENQTLENAGPDVLVHDRFTGATEKVVVAGNGAWGNGLASGAALSGDGRLVVFESHASNLVPGDSNTIADLFVHDRGAPVGVGDMAAFAHGDRVSVSGWATYSGQVISSATDGLSDGAPGADPAGAELTGASMIYRPESEDILVKLRLASIPSNRQVCIGASFCDHTGTGAPAVLYGLEFDFEPFRYEVRAVRSLTEFAAAPHFAVFRCTAICEESGEVASGGMGVSGDEVRISVPLRALGQPNGGSVAGIRAFTAIGEADSGALVPVDELALPDTSIPRLAVTMGIAAPGTPEEEVSFGPDEAIFGGGDFSGSVQTASLPPGEHDMWVRACLGTVCGSSSRPVTLG